MPKPWNPLPIFLASKAVPPFTQHLKRKQGPAQSIIFPEVFIWHASFGQVFYSAHHSLFTVYFKVKSVF
jgi:hypothetical protein